MYTMVDYLPLLDCIWGKFLTDTPASGMSSHIQTLDMSTVFALCGKRVDSSESMRACTYTYVPRH